MDQANRFALDALHHDALAFVSEHEWQQIVVEVEKAGGLLNVDGYALTILKKAAERKSFGGDRSAAGRYAAQARWGKKTTEGGSASANTSGGTKATNYATAFNDEGMLAETEASIHKAYDKSGFGAEKGDALAAVDGTRKKLFEAQKSLEAGIPVETVRGQLTKESRRLKSLSTRTRKKGQDLQAAEGGPKKDANGKWIMTRSARLFTDAQVIRNMGHLLDRTIRRLDVLKS
jgi:hypothetical protein